jgi:hypothetical protein
MFSLQHHWYWISPCVAMSWMLYRYLNLVSHPVEALNLPSSPKDSWKNLAFCAHMVPQMVFLLLIFGLTIDNGVYPRLHMKTFILLHLVNPAPLSVCYTFHWFCCSECHIRFVSLSHELWLISSVISPFSKFSINLRMFYCNTALTSAGSATCT